MKKLIAVLVVILILLALGIAAALGYVWYRENHIFVEDAVYPIAAETLDLRGQDISIAHYETVRGKLPGCRILWDVPFQGQSYPDDTTSLTVTTLSDEDIARMDYFPKLIQLDASGCREYDQIEKFMEYRPECKVSYQVSIGSKSFAPDTTKLELENGDYDFDTMMANLAYLHQMKAIRLRTPELTQEQITQLQEAYPDITFTCTVELLGAEYEVDVEKLDLSAMTAADIDTVVQKLPLLPNVKSIELMNAEGTSNLAAQDVKRLMEGAPEVVFNFTFDFYGYTLSTADEEVHIKNTRIGEEGIEEVRAVLDIMTNCKRFVLENCQISNETMAQLRDDYRGRTKIVWRVDFGKGSTMTDVHAIRATHGLKDSTNKNLIYCEDVRFMDLGHNGEEGSAYLRDITFVTGMPNLEAIILSGAYITDLTPFASCKNLKFLEIAFCGMVTDLSPLAECTSLEMLNIGSIKFKDLSALDNLPLTHLMARWYPSGKCPIPVEEQKRFVELHPDCWASFEGSQPYGDGWRYDEDGITPLPYYAMLRDVFKYDLDPNIPNHTGWYWDEEAYNNSLTEGEE